MDVLPKSLSHLNSEIASMIDLDAHHQSIKSTQQYPLCLIGVYGAMLSPLPDRDFIKRAGMTYKRNRFIENGEDLLKYYLGVYMMPHRKLVFNKIADEKHGFASLVLSENADYCYLSVYAVPKQLLQEGNGALMLAERCMDWDYYNPKNEYVLTNNIHPMLNVKTNEVIQPLQCFMFVAGQSYTNSNLIPLEEYRNRIVEQLKELQSLDYNISEHYINRISNL
jgi:hypothetical protein